MKLGEIERTYQRHRRTALGPSGTWSHAARTASVPSRPIATVAATRCRTLVQGCYALRVCLRGDSSELRSDDVIIVRSAVPIVAASRRSGWELGAQRRLSDRTLALCTLLDRGRRQKTTRTEVKLGSGRQTNKGLPLRRSVSTRVVMSLHSRRAAFDRLERSSFAGRKGSKSLGDNQPVPESAASNALALWHGHIREHSPCRPPSRSGSCSPVRSNAILLGPSKRCLSALANDVRVSVRMMTAIRSASQDRSVCRYTVR